MKKRKKVCFYVVPYEIIWNIMLFLDLKSIYNSLCVNKLFHHVQNYKNFWKSVYNLRNKQLYHPDQVWGYLYLRKNLLIEECKEIYFDSFFMFVDFPLTSANTDWSSTTIITENHTTQKTIVCYLNTERTNTILKIINFIKNDLEYFVNNFIGEYKSKIYLLVNYNTNNLEIHNVLKNNYLLKNKVVFIKKCRYKSYLKKNGDNVNFAKMLHEKILEKSLSFHKKCCTRNKKIGIKAIKEILLEQCTHVRKLIYNSRIISHKDFNGKLTKDDLYISFVSVLYFTMYLRQNQKKKKNEEN
jgi:hypothetical protein